jgi:hypothetical protein
MKLVTFLSVVVVGSASVLVLQACDEKKETPATPSATVSAAPPPPPPSATAVTTPSAEPSAVPGSQHMVTGEGTDDVTFTAKEPGKDGNQTVKAKAGGAFTLFLPDREGNSWAADTFAPLAKPKEESIPGFAPGAMGHMFKWSGLKAGKTTITMGYRKASLKGAGAPTQTFKITVDVN